MPEPRFPITGTARAALRRIGTEQEPLLTLDDMLVDPGALVAAAASSAFGPAWGSAGGYPGLRAPAPLDYVETVSRALLPILVEAFALPAARLRRAECNFSLATLPPGALHASQSAPHVDTVDPWQFAILHYLCDARFGGTAFFRHRATGFETLSADRLAAYDAARAGEEAGAGYITGSTLAFEEIDAVETRFDRIAVYRSRLLHSGRIAAPEALSDDPRRGRLTANIFLSLRPA